MRRSPPAFLPAAVWAGVPELGWLDVVNNWLFAFLGTLVGAVVFVATSYWYLFKNEPKVVPEQRREEV